MVCNDNCETDVIQNNSIFNIRNSRMMFDEHETFVQWISNEYNRFISQKIHLLVIFFHSFHVDLLKFDFYVAHWPPYLECVMIDSFILSPTARGEKEPTSHHHPFPAPENHYFIFFRFFSKSNISTFSSSCTDFRHLTPLSLAVLHGPLLTAGVEEISRFKVNCHSCYGSKECRS